MEGSIAFQMRRFAAAQVNDCGLQILNLSQAAARLAGGFAIAAPAELLEPAIQNALDDGGFVELEQVRTSARHDPGGAPHLEEDLGGRFRSRSGRRCRTPPHRRDVAHRGSPEINACLRLR